MRLVGLLAAVLAAALANPEEDVHIVKEWLALEELVALEEDVKQLHVILAADFQPIVENHHHKSVVIKGQTVTIHAALNRTNRINIDMRGRCRFFNITAGGTLHLIGPLDLSNGRPDSDWKEKTQFGGAVKISNGTLIAEDIVFKSNFAPRGGAIFVSGHSRAKITGCLFDDNQASSIGGAIAALSSFACKTCHPSLEVHNSRFLHNIATNGGAIDADTVAVVVTKSMFQDNSVDDMGGAISVYGQHVTLDISDSNFTRNSCGSQDCTGGAIESKDGTLTIQRTRFNSNNAGDDPTNGNAIYAEHRSKVVFPLCPKVTSCVRDPTVIDNCEGIDCCTQLTAQPDDAPGSRQITQLRIAGLVTVGVLGLAGIYLLVRKSRQRLSKEGSEALLTWKHDSIDGQQKEQKEQKEALLTEERQRDKSICCSDYEIDLSELVLRKRIGGGAAGIVFQGTFASKNVAIKRLTLSPDLDDEDEGIKSVVEEARLLWELRHERVLLFHGMSIKRSSLSTQIYLVTELCVGSLDCYLGQGRKLMDLGKAGAKLPTYSRSYFWQWMLEVAEGMAFLHSRKVLHRDLKPHNLFVSDSNNVKLGDLGLSRALKDGTTNATGGMPNASLTTNIGSPVYMAPELITMGAGTAHAHINGEAIDVYAFGIILNAMWREKEPFDYGKFGTLIALVQQVAKGMRPPIPEGEEACPMMLRRLMTRCWDPDPRKRPSFKEIEADIRKMAPRTDGGEDGDVTISIDELAIADGRDSMGEEGGVLPPVRAESKGGSAQTREALRVCSKS
jgi:serine/threonine protein kinase